MCVPHLAGHSCGHLCVVSARASDRVLWRSAVVPAWHDARVVCEVMSGCVVGLSGSASHKAVFPSVASLKRYLGCGPGMSRRISMGSCDVTVVSLGSSRDSVSVSQRRHGHLYEDLEGVSRASGGTRGTSGCCPGTLRTTLLMSRVLCGT